MKFLVLGGNGYLGSKIIHSLISNGDDIICTRREKSDLSRLSKISDQIIFIPASLDSVKTLLCYEKIDWVLNMAGTYGRKTVLYDSVIDSNIEFPLSILNTAVEQGVKNFMTIGTGLPDELNMYSFSKKMFADFGEFYVKKHNINFVEMKLEMFYGADEPEDRFLLNCIYKMLRNEPLELTEGTQHRDIVAIEDVVNAIMHVINTNINGFIQIPVGTGEAPTICEIIQFIHRTLDSKSELRFGAIPMRQGEPDCCANPDILNHIGYEICYTWRDGIQKLIGEIKNEKII